MKYCRIILLICMVLSLPIAMTVSAASLPVVIHVSGLQGAVESNVNLLLSNELKQTLAPTEAERVQAFYKESPAYIEKALKPYGYFKPVIQKQLSQTSKNWLIYFRVDPGPAMKLTSVELQIQGEGQLDSRFIRFSKNFALKTGQDLNVEAYQKAKNGLYSLAAERGYFNPKFVRSQMIIDLPNYQAHVIMIFDTGKRYRFGPTYFSNCTTLRLDFLERFLDYQQGEFYHSSRIQQTQQDLASSNYFQLVTVTPETDKTVDDEVPIKVSMTPSNPQQYIFGLGYGTDTGPRATIGIQLRQINDRGHYFNAIARPSVNDSTLTANYVIPGRRPARDQYTLNATIGQINQTSGNSHSYRAGPSYTTQSEKWSATLGAYYLDEHYQIKDLPMTSAKMLVPNFHLAHIHRKALINPKQGYNLSFDLAGASDAVLSKSSFIQEKIQGKFLYTLPTHTRLLARGQLGRTDISNLNNLPLSLQLFAGGSSSIRGYSYNSIGPGRNLLVASGEVQQRIYKSFYLAAFYDAGNVGNSHFLSDLKQGTGPGFVYLSPIGSFELTIARRFKKGLNHPSYVIQFEMGPDL